MSLIQKRRAGSFLSVRANSVGVTGGLELHGVPVKGRSVMKGPVPSVLAINQIREPLGGVSPIQLIAYTLDFGRLSRNT